MSKEPEKKVGIFEHGKYVFDLVRPGLYGIEVIILLKIKTFILGLIYYLVFS